jgi:hypothetical protein
MCTENHCHSEAAVAAEESCWQAVKQGDDYPQRIALWTFEDVRLAGA